MTANMRFVVLSALCAISFGSGYTTALKFKLKPSDVSRIQDPPDPKRINIPSSRVLQSKPTNTAVYAGENATFYCSSQPGSGARIQWWEWTSSSTPQLISDQDLLTRHPNGNKYQIEQPNSYTYNLVIQDVQLSDVGTYTCLDSAFGPPCSNVSAEQAGNIASADLIVLTSAPECDTTISPSGSVLEDAYHTAECVMYFRGKVQPTITWTGPSPFTVFRASTPTYAWCGIELNATRYMENLAFTAVSKFESSDPSSNFSDSAPMWNYTYQTPALNVSWGPKNLYVYPVKEFYHVGDVLGCYADAKPAATYVWQNMQNGDRFNTQTFTVSANMLDNTWTLRCQAMNNILGTIYSANVAVTVTVVTNPDTTAAEPQHSTEQTTEYLPTTGTQENNSSIGYPCETWFYNYEGEVVSFNYPWGYPPQYYWCNYYIYVYQSTPLTFTFNSPFEVGSNGYYGYVEIFSSFTGERYTYSGSSPPAPIYFSYNNHGTIQITYYSKSPFPEVGFSLNYTRESGALTTELPHDVTTGSISGTQNTSILMMRNDYDGSNSYFFNQTWAKYKEEFGNITSLYWIGLERLHEVSRYGTCRIRFDFQRQSGNWQFAEYSHFSVAGSSDNYRLSIGGYSGDFSDGMAYHDGQQFTTYDVDNDPYPGNCATEAGGGFWYNYCAAAKITGSPYYNFWWSTYLLFCEARMWC